MLNTFDTKQKLIESISNTKITNNEMIERLSLNMNFVCNPFVELIGNSKDEFKVEFVDGDKVLHSSTIKCNMWTKSYKSYYIDWIIRITNITKNQVIYNQKIDLADKKVYISFESKSLGDTLSWFPYVEEFRKKHKCQLIVSTFLNELFEPQYPQIQFVNPGQVVSNIYAQYRLGWFYENDEFNKNLHPCDFKNGPLQKTASDILGLDYKEIKPKLTLKNIEKKKKVGIGFHSTAQSKYWNNDKGWQEVVDYLTSLGYECVIYSKEENGYMGNYFPKGVTKFSGKLTEVIDDLQTCQFFIGIGSGLSWLAWSCELPVVLISGFSKRFTETATNTFRVINESVCNGCFNTNRLDSSDWNWCPKHKNTSKQFECSKNITSSMVIEQINKVLNGETQSVVSNFVQEDKKEISGWFSYSKIYDLFIKESKDDSLIVEIGSWFGKSTQYLLEGVKTSNKKINIEVIDTFKGTIGDDVYSEVNKFDGDIYQNFSENIDLDSNIVIHKNYSSDSSTLFTNNSIDFLMIDGDHSYNGVTSDIDNYIHKVKPGGIISGDDYNVWQETTMAVNDYFLGSHELYGNEYNWIWRKPRIQVVHLSTLPIQDRTKKSLKNIEILKKYGFDLKFIQNEPYTGQIDITKYANPLSKTVRPQHYGCYLAHVQALSEIDTENYDYTLVLEEDAYIYSSIKEFIDIIYKAICCFRIDSSLAYVSFGSDVFDNKYEYNNYFYKTQSQFLTHCYLVPNNLKDWYVDKINSSPWDSSDLWYNLIFQNSDKLRLVSKNTFSKQLNGVSIIDDVFKDYVTGNY